MIDNNYILVSGGYGFIGSHLIEMLHETYPHARILNIDCNTYAGNPDNLQYLKLSERLINIECDIADSEAINKVFDSYIISGIIHLAAESHVDNSLQNSHVFVRTNVLGTHNLLSNAYRQWMNGPHRYKQEYNKNRYIQVSTDEVYGSLGEKDFFTEDSPYAPNSPYSATKAGADMLVRSFYKSYGLNVSITRCSNNYGTRQHPEKLIPKLIQNALSEKSLPIYGDGKQIRDWLHVIDHCNALIKIFRAGVSGRNYNIGASCEYTNLELTKLICAILDQKHPRNCGRPYADLITHTTDRPGHDRRYSTDASRLKSEFHWMAKIDFSTGLNQTIDWYIEKFQKQVIQKNQN